MHVVGSVTYSKLLVLSATSHITAPNVYVSCFCAGGGFVPQDVYRLNVGVVNAASASYTDSLVSLAGMLISVCCQGPAFFSCHAGRSWMCTVSRPIAS